MNEININITKQQNTRIISGIDLLSNTEHFKGLTKDKTVVIISDSNVYKLYKEFFGNHNKIIIPPGEKEKSLKRIESILNDFVELGIDRNSLVVGFGGGVVCDIAGFAASIFMRGVNFGFIASTLLAQVDAAIGGKNGVNLYKNKNFAGLINQPEFVFCDVRLLKTLSPEEFKSGLAEIIKYAIIADPELFTLLKNNKIKILEYRDLEILLELVDKCIQIKNNIIRNDPNDNDLRRIFNFGHSFGHAIETESNLLHGMAIIKGMRVACEISVQKGQLSANVKKEILNLFDLYEYDSNIKISEKHFELIKNDKKKDKKSINFILINDIGKPIIENISFNDLEKLAKINA